MTQSEEQPQRGQIAGEVHGLCVGRCCQQIPAHANQTSDGPEAPGARTEKSVVKPDEQPATHGEHPTGLGNRIFGNPPTAPSQRPPSKQQSGESRWPRLTAQIGFQPQIQSNGNQQHRDHRTQYMSIHPRDAGCAQQRTGGRSHHALGHLTPLQQSMPRVLDRGHGRAHRRLKLVGA